MAYVAVMSVLKNANNDVFTASRIIHADYERGVYDEDEYLEMMDILASTMMQRGVK